MLAFPSHQSRYDTLEFISTSARKLIRFYNFFFFLQLLAPREVDSTIPIGSQPWHGTLPSNWIPIVSRDVSRQSNQEGQRPFSDAYLTTQAAKRRRLASNSKPSGTVSEVISDVITDAIQNTGIQPLSSVGKYLLQNFVFCM